MSKKFKLDGRSPQQLAKEREQRKRRYWHTRDKMKREIIEQIKAMK